MEAPAIAVVHVHEVRLAGAEFGEDDHPRSRGVEGGAFVEQRVGGPGVAEPDCGAAAGPEG